MEANQCLEEASAAERRLDASTKNLLLLCDCVDLACAHAPGLRAATAGSSAGAVHTLSLSPVSPREHKILGWQPDGLAEQWVHPAMYKVVIETRAVGHAQVADHVDAAEMARGMDAACQCEILADTSPALNADWGKLHNPWENARPHQVKR